MSTETIISIGSDHVVYKGPSVDGLVTYDSASTVIKKIYDEILKIERQMASYKKELLSKNSYVSIFRGFRPDTDVKFGEGPAFVYYDIIRVGREDRSCSVQWVVSGYGTNPANAADFAGGVYPAGIVTFLAWEKFKTISFSIMKDASADGMEQFKVDIFNPTTCVLHTVTAIGTIYKDGSE